MAKDWLIVLTENAAIIIDALALIVIVIGTIEAVVEGLRLIFSGSSDREKRELWLRYARWLVAGLTFQLAADIIETSISTSWDSVGSLPSLRSARSSTTSSSVT